MKFKVNDLVMLQNKHLKLQGPSRKLSTTYIGPFLVVDTVGAQAYRLQLPVGSRIYPVINVSRLEVFQRCLGGAIPEFTQPILHDGESEWEVEKITGKQNRKG